MLQTHLDSIMIETLAFYSCCALVALAIWRVLVPQGLALIRSLRGLGKDQTSEERHRRHVEFQRWKDDEG